MFYNTHCHFLQKHPHEISIYNLFGDETEIPQSFFSAGFHPWQMLPEDRIEYYQTCLVPKWQNEHCVAIGEIGLDKVKGIDWQIQIYRFKAQLNMAKKFDKPVIIHSVKAYYEVLSILNQVKWDKPYIFHGFNKSYTLAKDLLQKGAMLSFGMALDDNRFIKQVFMPVWKEYPAQILLESDTNPIPIQVLYQKIADNLNVPLSVVCQVIQNTVEKTFGHLS